MDPREAALRDELRTLRETVLAILQADPRATEETNSALRRAYARIDRIEALLDAPTTAATGGGAGAGGAAVRGRDFDVEAPRDDFLEELRQSSNACVKINVIIRHCPAGVRRAVMYELLGKNLKHGFIKRVDDDTVEVCIIAATISRTEKRELGRYFSREWSVTSADATVDENNTEFEYLLHTRFSFFKYPDNEEAKSEEEWDDASEAAWEYQSVGSLPAPAPAPGANDA